MMNKSHFSDLAYLLTSFNSQIISEIGREAYSANSINSAQDLTYLFELNLSLKHHRDFHFVFEKEE
jgi:hypothetical protein